MIGVAVTGADGSSWDLRTGQVVLLPGAEGFGMPKFERPTQEAPNIDGQRLQSIGSRAKARSGILPVALVPQDTEAAWLALQRAWWAAWSPDVASTISVTDPAGGTRQIAACYDDDEGYGLDLEPTVNLYEKLPISWVADDPWWKGPVASTVLVVPSGGDYLVGGTAPPFQFQTAAQIGSGTLANPGETPAWPVYTAGPGSTSFAVTVNGQTTAGTITVPAGGRLVVDTDPNVQTALLYAADGSVMNVTPQLSAVAFAPVLVGGSVPVTTSLQGANGATLTVAIRPRYRRAF